MASTSEEACRTGTEDDLVCLNTLPTEMVLLIMTSPGLRARDLVSLELVCSRFRERDETGATVGELAAKHALRTSPKLDPQLCERIFSSSPSSQSPNLKSLLHHLVEDPYMPVFSCPRCKWLVGGFRCQGHRFPYTIHGWAHEDMPVLPEEAEYEVPPVPTPTGCGSFLVWDQTQQRLCCPLGCGSVSAPACSCRVYARDSKVIKDNEQISFEVMEFCSTQMERLEREALADQPKPMENMKETAPAMTCVCCGYTVAEYVCLGMPSQPQHPPYSSIVQQGTYENTFAAYRWGCSSACSIIRSGDAAPDRFVKSDSALLCCTSTPECRNGTGQDNKQEVRGIEMATLQWLDTKGPPTNWYVYRPVKPAHSKPCTGSYSPLHKQ